jgi:uncharacterized membrane protein YfcA
LRLADGLEAIALCFFALLAGFVDSVAGGGGLIQLPALLVVLPESHSLAAISGTNKLSSICGTGVAVAQYLRRVAVEWRLMLPAAAMALIFSWLGARTVVRLRRETLEPVFLALMIGVAIYTVWKKDFGKLHGPKLTARRAVVAALLTGMVFGFYDGFFGPGTGSFLIFVFVAVFGFDFLRASASAKWINLATNLAAVSYFGWSGNILYRYALPMAACNVAGSFIGARLAIAKGNQFVRGFFLCVIGVMIARFAWKMMG